MATSLDRTFKQWLGRIFEPPPRLVVDRDGRLNQTERACRTVMGISAAALLVIALFAVVIGWNAAMAGVVFFLWASLTAAAAWLVGALLGLLFGLPSVAEVRVTDGSQPSEGGTVNVSLGYRDSTNLEQVADWVTKILIGISLTQWHEWEKALGLAFSRVGDRMFPGGSVGSAPAAIIAIGFVTSGFLVSYLIMRRYFITEMVAGRVESDDKLKQMLANKARAGLVQTESVTRQADHQAEDVRSIATKAANLTAGASGEAAQAIAEDVRGGIEYPDDPWRGKFGGSNVGGDCTLTASVVPLEGADQLYTVRLNITASNPASRTGQSATFYLHPTFGSEPKRVAFGPDGRATLELIAYGAFTVGVLLEGGTKLELNLATLPDAPELFRLR